MVKLHKDVVYLQDVMRQLGLSDLEVIDMLAKGKLKAPGKIPKHLQTEGHMVCWLQSDVDTCLAALRN